MTTVLAPGVAPRPRRRLRRWLVALVSILLALVLLLGLAVAAALQDAPRVVATPALSPDDVARALSLLRTHDPREARPGMVSTALVLSRDVEVLIDHGARRWVRAASQLTLQRGGATLLLSLPAPGGARWINLELQLAETGGLPAVERLRVGRLPVPAWVAERVVLQAVERAGLQAELTLVLEVVRRVRFKPDHLLVTYAWDRDSAGRLFAGLVPADELARLKPYAERLAQLTQARPDWQAPMVELLPPLFALAASRSSVEGADAAAENRAALTVLTLFANGRHVGHVTPLARGWARPRPLRLLLAGRPDFPLHFLVSAALATETTGVLSQAVGVYKELADARGGSGFSFNDMVANRAGTRFGERLLHDPRAMQQRLSSGVSEADLLPAWADLPEFMPEAEFQRRFGGVGAPAYNAQMAEIERRIRSLPLLR